MINAKFRAVFNVSYTLENEEEKEIKIIVEDVGVYGGSCWFSVEELRLTLNKLNLSEKQKAEIETCLNDNSHSMDEDFINIFPQYLEQHIGRKDKNGKEIYAGDIVKNGPWKNDIHIVTPLEQGSFGTKDVRGHNFIISVLSSNAEIIGNIHDNPELLEQKGDVK